MKTKDKEFILTVLDDALSELAAKPVLRKPDLFERINRAISIVEKSHYAGRTYRDWRSELDFNDDDDEYGEDDQDSSECD